MQQYGEGCVLANPIYSQRAYASATSPHLAHGGTLSFCLCLTFLTSLTV